MKRILSVVTVLVAMAASRLVAAEPMSERQLPPNVLLYMSVPNVTEFKAQWQKTSVAKLRDDERLADFWADVDEQLERASDKVEREIGLSLKELGAIPSGEVAFAVVVEPRQDPTIMAFVGFGEKKDEVEQLLDRAQQALNNNTEAERSVEDFEGTQLVSYAFPEIEQSDSPIKPRLVYCIHDTTLLVGSSAAGLKSVLARWDGQHPQTFATNETYQYILDQCATDGRAPEMKWFADPLGAFNAVLRVVAQENPQVGLAAAFLPILGVNKVKGVGGVANAAVGEFDEISKTLLYVEQPPSGLLNLFRFPEMNQSPPRWVPAEIDSFTVANWDAQAAYQAVESLLDSFVFRQQGGLAAKLDEFAEREDGIAFHPKEDLIDQLAGPIYSIGFGIEPNGEAGVAANGVQPQVTIPKMLVALAVKDEAKMKGLLSELVQDGGALEIRDFNGHTIYDVDVQPQGVPAANLPGMSFAVAKGNFLFSTDVKGLEQVLRDENPNPLSGLPEFKKIAAHFPEQTAMMSFQRRDSQLRSAYEMLRSGQMEAQFPGIDFTKLPDFDVIKEYLPATGSFVVSDKNGAKFVTFTLPTK